GMVDRDYWRDERRYVGERLPVDKEGENRVWSGRVIGSRLSEERTRELLREAPSAYHTQINDLLLTALGEALCKWSGRQAVLVDVEGHGREEMFKGIDLTRTVGWFTTIYPVVLGVREWETDGEKIKRVKEELRGIPRSGMGYGMLRYVCG